MSRITEPRPRADPISARKQEPERWITAWRSPRNLLTRVGEDSLLRNGLFMMLTIAVNSFFGYGFWLVAARLFPPSTVGLSAALISAVTLISLLASMGVSGTLIQSLPEHPSPADWALTFWTGMVAATLVSLILGCAVLVILPVASREFAVLAGPTLAVAFLIGIMAWTAGSILDSTFIALRGAGNMLWRNVVVAASKLLAVVLAVIVLAREVVVLVGAWTVAGVLGVLFGGLLLVRRVGRIPRPRPRAIAPNVRRLRSRLIGNQLIGIGAQMPVYLLPLVITTRLSSTANAYFYTTWMMCGIFLVISPAVSTSLFAEGVHAPGAMRDKTRATLAIIGVLLAPAMILFLVFGGHILGTFGSSYEQHGLLLMQLVVFAAVPDAITNVYVAVLRVQQRLAVAAWLNLAMGVGTVIFAWLLLRTLGISAVGWSWMAMQAAGCAFVAVDVVRRRLPPPSWPPPSWPERGLSVWAR
jgi:O-antigen/teichoic acid export membrane protein